MPRDFPACLAMVIYAPQVISTGHGREGAIKRQDFQSVSGKIKVADYLRPQQRYDVRTNGKFESGENFFRHRGPAEHVTALQHEDFLTRACEIRGVGQAIVSAADYDYVVFGFRAVGSSSHIFGGV